MQAQPATQEQHPAPAPAKVAPVAVADGAATATVATAMPPRSGATAASKEARAQDGRSNRAAAASGVGPMARTGAVASGACFRTPAAAATSAASTSAATAAAPGGVDGSQR